MVCKRTSNTLQEERGGRYLKLKHSATDAKRTSAACQLPPSPSPAVSYNGVRMRVWGKWVTEVRDPVTKTRIWLGSFATAEMAARAYDAAVVSLKGASAPEVNFPDSIPSFVVPHSNSSPKEIQAVALAAATASVPTAAPLAMAATPIELANPLHKECESPLEVPSDREFDSDGGASCGNTDIAVNYELPEPECSVSSNVEDWIHNELDFDDLETAAGVVDPLIELSEFMEPSFLPWLMTSSNDFEDAEDLTMTHHDMQLWSFA